MELNIYNPSMVKTAVCDEFISVIWTRRYDTFGDCEVYVPATTENLSMFAIGNYIRRADSTMVCRIEKTEVRQSAENGDYLIVVGYDVLKILGQRIIWSQTNFSGTAENFIRKIINENVISPTDTNRRINAWALGPARGYSNSIGVQRTYENVLETITEICKQFGYGCRALYNNGFVFDLYKGVDRTQNNLVVFSSEYENLAEANASKDYSAYRNVALVAGEGEGTDRKTTTVGSASGMNRYELYVDSRGTSSTSETTITDPEYLALLVQEGQKKLAETQGLFAYDGNISDYQFVLGTDYNLGDIVLLKDDYGNTSTVRVVEIIESEDATGRQLIPTFELVDASAIQGAILTEESNPITSENNTPLVVESAEDTAETVKISNLPNAQAIAGTELIPMVQNGATVKSSAFASHLVNTSNPHSITKAQVGLGNVENYVATKRDGQLISNTDLNTLTTPGTYYCLEGCTNAPRNYFALQVIKPNPNGTQINQFGFSANGDIFYSRAYTGGSWTAWKSVALA